MNFERRCDVKAILEIGGIDLQKKYDETVGVWEKYFNQFVGRTIKFHVKRSDYNNWEDRIKNGELVEVKTMKVKEAANEYSGNPGDLYFMEEGSQQCWFVDMSEKIYILK
jgi:hypothetical protein